MVKLQLPNRGRDHNDDKISKYHKGRFLVTEVNHEFTNGESKTHLMQIKAFRDSLPEPLPLR
jgi:hypothetical protein